MREFSSHHFEALLESAPDAILLVDDRGRIVLANRRAVELFGFAADELLGMPVDDLVPQRFRERHAAHRDGYVRAPRTREMGAGLELYGRRRDDTEFPVEISLSPMRIGDETLVTTIVRDVTERRAAEARFRVLLESAPDAILLVGEAGRIVLANRRASELFGFSTDELLAMTVNDLVPERLRERHKVHRAAYHRAPRTREMGAGLELYGRRRDGMEFPVEISLSPMRVGAETLVTTIVRDVTERRAAEQARLRFAREQAARAEADAARERFETLLDDIDGIVWEADDAHRRRFTFVNRRAEDILGYRLSRWTEELDFFEHIVHPDDRESVALFSRELASADGTQDIEYRVLAADGRTLWMRDIVRAVHGDSASRASGVMLDVTERHELEARLLRSHRMEAVGKLAGGIAHDFNNLLTVIRGYGSMAESRAEDPGLRDDLREILRAAERAADLTAQLLAFARRGPRSPQEVELDGVVAGLRTMLHRLIGEDIVLTIQTGAGPATVRIDPAQLEQVIVNLVVNARDAMPAGGRLTLETARRERDAATDPDLPPGLYASLTVSDTGSGMDPRTLERIFEPFFTTKEPGKGTGLGLATVYGVVEQAGGRIFVDSEPGKGARFTVLLPTMETAAIVTDRDVRGAPRSTIMLVEDEPAVRRLARSVLEREGYRVLEAEDGRQALELIERHGVRFDLLLTDVIMPHLNGPELVSRLGTLRPDLRVMYISGYTDSRLVAGGLAKTNVTILHKPFLPEDLARKVRELLPTSPVSVE